MKIVKTLALMLITLVLLGVGFIYSGLYPMGADNQHNRVTYWMLETLRERSITRSASDINVADLTDPELLLAGGPDYNEMCAGCHLKPGVDSSDMSIGLYPNPPNLASRTDEHGHNHGETFTSEQAAKRNFWIIKHGIKASGMPAWGPTHEDKRIWAMVAFLQRLPDLSTTQYQILTARSDDEADDHH